MANEYPTGAPGAFEASGSSSVGQAADVVQGQAGELRDQAADSGRHVVETAKDQAADVADEVKYQAKDLMAQAREELQAQAREQQQRVADGLQAVSGQFQDMASRTDADGVAVELVRQAADKSRLIADWIGARDPGSVVGELRDFASRRPGVFIGAAAAAGLLVGRLTRATVEGDPDAQPGGDYYE